MKKEHAGQNGRWWVAAAFLSVAVLLGVGIALLITQCRIETMKVRGNIHYSDQQIRKLVRSSHYIDNSILLTAKTKVWHVRKKPFIDSIDIHLADRNTVLVEVTEKPIAACVLDGKNYVYFDQNGTVTDVESRYLDDIPLVEGVAFGKYAVRKTLDVEDQAAMDLVLQITECMAKSGMRIDKILLTEEKEIYLFRKEVCVRMGTSGNLEIKLANLPDMMAKADDLSGTLHMENYSERNKIVSFIKGEKPDFS